MRLDDIIKKYSYKYLSVQREFFNIKMKSYFDFLEKRSGNTGRYTEICNILLTYSNTDENYVYDLVCRSEHTQGINTEITLGEMLVIAGNMTSPYDIYPENLHEYSIKTGEYIIENIMILPFKDQNITKGGK